MVLDISSFREQEDPDALGPEGVRDIQKKRFKDVDVVDKIMKVDEEWRQCQFRVNRLNKAKNAVSKAVGTKKKAKEADGDTDVIPQEILDNISDLTDEQINGLCVLQLRNLSKEVALAQQKAKEEEAALDNQRSELVRTVGNVLHESVPVHSDEDFNRIERTIGDAAVNQTRKKYSHVDLIEMIGGVDTKRGAVTAGNRGYYLQGAAVCLETALVQFSTQLLMEQDFVPLSPPVFMCKEVMQQVAQLNQFDEELYKVTGKASEVVGDNSVSEKYLIATSEQPIAAFHREEALDAKSLPRKYIGVSECFRQEVGSHGRDTTGIFRVHQFKKIEQFCITAPDKSWETMEVMLANAENFLKLLGLPYQVVTIVSGALNLAAAKKNDVEAWFPGSGAFRELVSCSNCTDYQSRRLNIKHGQTKKLNAKAEFVHMLNSTLCATTRTICCILENFQVGDFESGGGVVVPEVLRPFMPPKYKVFIPFVNPAPIEEEKKKKKGKKGKGKKKGGN
eukprot:m.224465 g.224465  ORF g.224465 m.224465 type:complete len:506 (-) comp13852_c2_seq36:2737-4254(-)